jgi:hypothetical protein
MNVRKKGKRTDHTGSTFDTFLEEEGIREEVEAVAIKRVLAWQLANKPCKNSGRPNKRWRSSSVPADRNWIGC